jgi:hypothetical protein
MMMTTIQKSKHTFTTAYGHKTFYKNQDPKGHQD